MVVCGDGKPVDGRAVRLDLLITTTTFLQAYRMMQDLGIHLDDENDPGFQDLSLEEKEVRRTLWVCPYDQ